MLNSSNEQSFVPFSGINRNQLMLDWVRSNPTEGDDDLIQSFNAVY